MIAAPAPSITEDGLDWTYEHLVCRLTACAAPNGRTALCQEKYKHGNVKTFFPRAFFGLPAAAATAAGLRMASGATAFTCKLLLGHISTYLYISGGFFPFCRRPPPPVAHAIMASFPCSLNSDTA